MVEHLITPKLSRWEKLESEISGFTPQVKAALIGGLIVLLGSMVSCIGVHNETSRLRAKLHDLEMEMAPFRNLQSWSFAAQIPPV